MTVGERIKASRKYAGLTQAQLAEKCGVAAVTIRQYESNKRQPRWEQMVRIANALNVSAIDLLSYGEKPKSYSSGAEFDADWNAAADKDGGQIGAAYNGNGGVTNEYIPSRQERIIAALECMTTEGQQNVVNYAEDLAGNPKYQRSKRDD